MSGAGLEQWAKAYWERGLAVVPLRGKRPLVPRWQERRLSLDELLPHLSNGATGLGVVAGELSGGLLVLDFDGDGWAHAFRDFCQRWPEQANGPTVRTGSGKRHLWLHCPDLPKDFTSKRFARPDLSAVIELRGNACNCVVPPSIHPDTGEQYAWISPENAEPSAMLFEHVRCWLSEWSGEVAMPEVRGQVKELQGLITVGQRNSALASVAGSLRRRGLEEEEITGMLRVVNESRCKPPLADAELAQIGRSIAKYEPADQLRVEYNLTDVGNSLRLVARHGDRLRYCPQLSSWLIWNGRCWEKDDSLQVDRLAKDTVASIARESVFTQNQQRRVDVAKHSIKSERVERLRAMLTSARSELTVTVGQLDTDKWLLNCMNGLLDLRSGQLKPHDPKYLITRLAPVRYDPKATSPQWQTFLDRIMASNAELIEFLQRAIGYALTGDTSEQCLFVLCGSGANGKSTFLEVIRAMLGSYALTTDPETLLAKRKGAVPNDLARLRRARMVTSGEVEEGRRVAEPLIKQITGGDAITARFLYGEWFEFYPSFKYFLATNHEPVIHGTDHAIWRRIRLVSFPVTIPEAEQDKRLVLKLKEELPGILTWAVEGCQKWQRDGLGMPPAVRTATQRYRSEMDSVGGFLSQCCDTGDRLEARAGELYVAYSA